MGVALSTHGRRASCLRHACCSWSAAVAGQRNSVSVPTLVTLVVSPSKMEAGCADTADMARVNVPAGSLSR